MSQKIFFNSRTLSEMAIVAALAMAISFVPLKVGWFEISLGTILIVLISLRHGTATGLVTGLIWGLLHFVLGKVYFLSIPQVLIEYILAFSSAGLAGLARQPFIKTGKNRYIILSMVLASIAKYFWHFIAGIIFWGDYAWKGWGSVSYSFIINGTSCLLTIMVGSIIILTIKKAAPTLFKT